MLKNVKFETSVFDYSKLLKTDKKQIVLVGKSNVGKSSFINALANQKKLAKVGQTPGKTRSINYYNVNNEFYIVDLPGYGYSTMSEAEKMKINKLIDTYISNTKEIKHIYFLVDIRNNPTQNDRQMYEWLLDKKIPFTIIATKADKIAKTKMDEYTKEITKALFAKEKIIPFSSDKKINIELVCDEILNIIQNEE
ncbi:MAG: YihA family ribosome biogenesis GTP-binding protein [Clostridia bacterium]|nr:YihA family ribosome biogenesis GTP-binding protein [Clostridia bacterium]